MTENERILRTVKNAMSGLLPVHKVENIAPKVAESLIANNVTALPNIPIGTTLYQIYKDKVYKLELASYMVRESNGEKIIQWHLYRNGFNGGGNVNEFGKTVFLTKEEAEQALRKEDEGK